MASQQYGALIDVQTFETVSLYVFVGGLILFMGFIMYNLAQRSGAGRMGAFAIFGVLGFGVLGFVIKEVLIHTLDM